MKDIGKYFGAMAAGVPYTPPSSLVDTNPVLNASDRRNNRVDTNPVLNASDPRNNQVGRIQSQTAQLVASSLSTTNGSPSDEKKEEEEEKDEFETEIAIQTISQIAERFRGIEDALNSAEVARYQGLMEEQSTIDMEIKNSYDYKNAMHDTVMIDDEGNVYVAEEDMDGNYTHYRLNPDGTKEIDPDADEKIASGKLRGVFFQDDHFKFLDGTRLSDQQVATSQQILHSANTSLEREARIFNPAKASVNCHDAREEAVNAEGTLKTLQQHVTITEDNVSDIFLDMQAAKLRAVETKMKYAVAMAVHKEKPEEAAAAAKDLKDFQTRVEEFKQFRIKADSLTPLGKDSLLKKTYGNDWTKYKEEALKLVPVQSINTTAQAERQPSTPAPAAPYGERSASHVQDDKGIQGPELSTAFNTEAPKIRVDVPDPAQQPSVPAQQPPAPVRMLIPETPSHCR